MTLLTPRARRLHPTGRRLLLRATDVQQAWHESDAMFRGIVRGQRITGDTRQYVVEIRKPYSGCTQPGSRPRGDPGVVRVLRHGPLDLGTQYLLSATNTGHGFAISACGFNVRAEDLSRDEVDWLSQRPVVCEAENRLQCADRAEPVHCFANPCDVVDACEPGLTCEVNPCSDAPCEPRVLHGLGGPGLHPGPAPALTRPSVSARARSRGPRRSRRAGPPAARPDRATAPTPRRCG
ncbi:MAG: hypothetical protein R3F59_29810 [Myxococcota bacterium]